MVVTLGEVAVLVTVPALKGGELELQLPQIKQIGRGGDLATIVAGERFLVRNDLERYSNSQSMKSSLKTALIELNVIEKHLPVVADQRWGAGFNSFQRGTPTSFASAAMLSMPMEIWPVSTSLM